MKIARIINESTTSKLYHGTHQSLLPSILKHGLDPAESGYAEEEEYWGKREKLPPPYHFIYLSERPHIARSFAPGGEYKPHVTDDQPAMLEIQLPQELQNKLVLDRGEFVRAPFVVPPKYIRVMDASEF